MLPFKEQPVCFMGRSWTRGRLCGLQVTTCTHCWKIPGFTAEGLAAVHGSFRGLDRVLGDNSCLGERCDAGVTIPAEHEALPRLLSGELAARQLLLQAVAGLEGTHWSFQRWSWGIKGVSRHLVAEQSCSRNPSNCLPLLSL